MGATRHVFVCLVVLCTASLSSASAHGFIENKGQFPASVAYVGSARGFWVIVEHDRVALQLQRTRPGTPVVGLPEHLGTRLAPATVHGHTLLLDFGSNAYGIEAQSPSDHMRHYLRGANVAENVLLVREYQRLQLSDRRSQHRVALEINDDGVFTLDGVKPGTFAVRSDGLDATAGTVPSQLDLHTAAGSLGMAATTKRVSSHTAGGDPAWALSEHGDELTAGLFSTSPGVVVAAITLSYSTFLGGSGLDEATSVGYRPGGNEHGESYLCGRTLSPNFPVTVGAFQTLAGSLTDAFVARQSVAQTPGLVTTWTTYLGGSDDDRAFDLSVHANGSVAVVGYTSSSNFPTTTGSVLPTYQGSGDAFVSRLSADGTTLVTSTFLGGSDLDVAFGVLSDASGTHVTGSTLAADFPLAAPAPNNATLLGLSDGFITSLDAALTGISTSTLISGTNCDAGEDIAIDAQGRLHVAGTADSVAIVGLPASGIPGFDALAAGGNDNGFVVAFDPATSLYVHRTFIEGSQHDGAHGVAVDSNGHVYVSGYAISNSGAHGFPVTAGAYDTTHNGAQDGYVAKLDFNNLLYLSYLGGSGDEVAWKLAVPEPDVVVVTGQTASSNFPVTAGAFQSVFGGVNDAFLARLQLLAMGSSDLESSSFLGGRRSDIAFGLALTGDGNTAHVSGFTGSATFPTSITSIDPTFNGGGDAFLARIALP